MRKQKIMAMGAVALMVAMSVAAFAVIDDSDGSDAASTDNLTYSYDSNTKTLTISGKGEMKAYSFNSNLGTLYTGLENVVINNGVTSIGRSAFYHCTSLTSITIPDSVTSIGSGAFDRTSLTSITIPDSVTSIGNNAFAGCSNLTSVTIPGSVTSIEYNTFVSCTSLTSITIPDSVTSIDNDAFAGCTSLTSITIPDSVTSIGDEAFADCTSLTSITIPDSVTSIGDEAFYRCTSLTTIWNASSVAFAPGDYGTPSTVTIKQGYPPEITVSDAVIIAGTTWSATVVPEGNTVTVSGADWLTASGNKISGTPTTAGSYTVTVWCNGQSASFAIKVISKLDVTNSPAGGLIVMPK